MHNFRIQILSAINRYSIGFKTNVKMKNFDILNTMKRKDLKSLSLLPSISIGYHRYEKRSCMMIHFRFLNIWVYYKKDFKTKNYGDRHKGIYK